MEFLEVVKKRRSTRNFSSKPVKEEDIIALIESARYAPSAANRQNWFFVILKGEEKEKVVRIMQKYLEQEEKVLNSRVKSPRYSAVSSLRGSIHVIQEAPILILALRKEEKAWLEGDYLSMGAAIENICLTATNLGLASLWLRDVIYVRDKILKAFHYCDMDLISAVAIGISKEFPYKRKKKNLEEIMKWV